MAPKQKKMGSLSEEGRKTVQSRGACSLALGCIYKKKGASLGTNRLKIKRENSLKGKTTCSEATSVA